MTVIKGMTTIMNTRRIDLHFLKAIALFLILVSWSQTLNGQNGLSSPVNIQVSFDINQANRINITWEHDTTGNSQFLGYRIYENGINILGSLTDTTFYSKTLSEEGTYIYRVQAVYYDGFSDLSNRGIITYHQQMFFEFTLGNGNGISADIWDIYLEEGKLGEAYLCPGDELSIYDGTLLVGKMHVNKQPSDEVEGEEVMIAYTQFSEGPGYSPGNDFSFKLWDASTETLYIEYTYTFDNDEYAGDVFPEGDTLSYLTIEFEAELLPPNITEIETEGHDVHLQWELSQNTNVIGYDIYRDGTKLNDEPFSQTSYTDEDVVSGDYSYQIKALYDEGESAFSDPAEVTIGLVFFDPEPLAELFEPMTIEIQQAQLMDSSLKKFDEIGVFKKTDEEELCLAAKSLTEDFSSETLLASAYNPESNAPGFEEGDTLFFRFYEYNNNTEYKDVIVSAADEADTSLTFIPGGVTHLMLTWQPYAPKDVELEVVDYDVHLSWSEHPANNELNLQLQGYNVYRDSVLINDNLLQSANYTDSNLMIDDYTYHIEGVYNNDVPSRWSSPVSTSIASQHFLPLQEQSHPDNMTFTFSEASVDGLSLVTYDQVAVFAMTEADTLICVGAGSIRDSITEGDPLEIIAYKDDTTTDMKDGFAVGDSIYYKFWDESTGNVYSRLNRNFPGDTVSHFTYSGTCEVGLTFTTPPPVRFILKPGSWYCTNVPEEVQVTTEDFQNISGFSLKILLDTAMYSLDSVTARQPFLETFEAVQNTNILTIDWEAANEHSLDESDTLFTLHITGEEKGQTAVNWQEVSFTGMEYQTHLTEDASFSIETLPYTPSAISGDNEVCNGTAFSHYSIAAISNADTYSWQLTDGQAGTLSSSGLSATLFWNDAFEGSTTLTAAGVNMCGTGEASQKEVAITNTVFTNVSLSLDMSTGCEGDTITITAFGTNGGNNPVHDWYINDNLHYIHQPEITRTDFEDGDEIYCIFTSSSECAINNPAQSETIELDLDPLPAEPAPITGPDEICNTVPVSYYTTTGAQNADDYVWTVVPEGTGEVISDGNNAEVHWNTETHGPAYVNVKGINNCGAGPVRQKTTVREYCTDITSIKPALVKVYPNPTKNSLTIAIPTIPAEAAYRLSNLQGLTLKTGLLTDRNTVVDLTSLRHGVYIIQITLGDQIFYHKVIKQ